MAFWGTKAAISLKRVKMEEKLLWTAYRKSPTLFRTVPSPTPYSLPSSKLRIPRKYKTVVRWWFAPSRYFLDVSAAHVAVRITSTCAAVDDLSADGVHS